MNSTQINLEEIMHLKEFRNRWVEEEKNKKLNEAFDSIYSFSQVLAVMPSYIKDIRNRVNGDGQSLSMKDQEKLIRMVIDLIDTVKKDQVEKFNKLIYEANMMDINKVKPNEMH